MDISTLAGVIPVGWLPWVTLAVTLASSLDASLPQPAVGSRWVMPRRVLHVIALNVGNARNAVPAGTIPASVAAHAAEVRQAAASVEESAATLSEAAQGEPEALSPGRRA